MRRYVIPNGRPILGGSLRQHRRSFAAGRTVNRFLRKYKRNYLAFNRRLRMSGLQFILYYNRLTPAQKRRICMRFYRTGTSRIFYMRGRRPRLRHMRTDY